MSRLTEIASAFVRAIVNGEAHLAHAMLAPELANSVSASELIKEYDLLAGDMGGVTNIGEPMLLLEDWPSKGPNDLGIVYVPVEGDVYSEAITVTLSELDNNLRITNIEWGRP